MALNQLRAHTTTRTLTAPSGGVTGGSPLRVGAYVGVPIVDAPEGAQFALQLDGSYKLPVTGALTEGQLVYLKTDGTLTATATGNHPWGTADKPKGTGSDPVEVTPLGTLHSTAASA